ncbi:hypothetical protein C6P46_006566 [Rhodotorula mucilaginosa]|uniref:RecQ-mediated genome instability protein 1 n=1 Tax=Rhodotorula mucilaginosa TaxID=5537 RepID=A0A9P7B3N0_RHOMI|nr:hypothetical protein C6P46_006566 [Rhodotorula mucilaginosa]TKA53961.1 hypothetical protein B0A53_03240 [Rhodotorula sp. CCFEE 5036]
MPTGIPDAVYRWYHSSYPTLSFNPDWLQACVDYLLEYDPVAKASVPGLIKAIEVQLLSSDLSTSVLPPSTNTSFLQANHPDPDPHAHEQKRRVLFRAPDSDLPTQNKNNSKKAGVLVQIVQVDDVAHSALSLSETLQEKKEARKLAAKGRAGGDGDGGRIMDLNDDAEDDEGDLDAEAKRRALLHGGKGGGGGPSFPRGSGRFVLTDGGPAQWTAFELQRIAGMGLEELRLGTKLLIRDVPCINGILMLMPQNTIVKGFQVEELDSVREWYFENAFRSRLGLEPLPDPRGGGAPEMNIEPPPPAAAAAAPAAAAPRPPPPRANNNKARGAPHQPPRQQKADDEEEDYFGDDLDLDLADFEMADQLAREASAAAARGPKANDRMDHDEDDDDEEEEEEALREMRRLESAANFKPGPTPSPHKPPPQQQQLKSEKSSNSSFTNARGRLGGGGRPTRMAVKSSSGVSGGGVEVLDLDDDDDDEIGSGKRREAAAEDIKPVRKKVKAEPVQAERERRKEDEPPRRGTRRTVIEIEDSD